MTASNPLKRSKQLAPFSREHHQALVFLLRIKQGLTNRTSITVISDYINWFWINNLKNHFDQEEELLLPQLPPGDELASQLKSEHGAIRNMISKNLNEREIVVLCDLLYAHIRFEERRLFPHIEAKISPEALNAIFEQMDHPNECETTWSNRFWSKKKS